MRALSFEARLGAAVSIADLYVAELAYLRGKPSHFAEIDAQILVVDPAQYRGILVVSRFVADKQESPDPSERRRPSRLSFGHPMRSQKRAIASARTPRSSATGALRAFTQLSCPVPNNT